MSRVGSATMYAEAYTLWCAHTCLHHALMPHVVIAAYAAGAAILVLSLA
jgi:hypothetical protein